MTSSTCVLPIFTQTPHLCNRAISGNTSTITVIPANGFTGSVALTSAVTTNPAGAIDLPTLSFGQSTPISISGAKAGTATLRISTTSATTAAARHPNHRGKELLAASGALFACIVLFRIPAQRRKLQTLLGLICLFIALAMGTVACGGHSTGNGGGNGNPGTTPGRYTITVTGASGSLTQTATLTLTVN
jgi:trimeric autotransporter adhesin